MDVPSQILLAKIIRSARIASLATIRDGEPFLVMLPFAANDDFSAFFIFTTRLAQHAVDMRKNRRVGLLIAETDDNRDDPATFARVALRGSAEIIQNGEPGFSPARDLLVKRIPASAARLKSDDSILWRIKPKGGRFVNGTANAVNLSLEALTKVAAR